MSISAPARKRRGTLLFGPVLILAVLACTIAPRPLASIPTIDPNATDETKALFMKLWTVANTRFTLFGHQDDLYRGVGWVDVPGRSDVRETTDSYPAVYGWDVGGVELGPDNVDGIPLDRIRDLILQGYRRGGVITISWHMSNPVTGGNFYDMTPAVDTIIPGGANHAMYVQWLDAFAAFDRSLTVSGVPWNENEHLVPVIFRPFHEHNGSVFWWGGSNTNEADFIALWRFTVEYLRDVAGLHNLLYAYSPDARFMHNRGGPNGTYADLGAFQRAYFYAYPGDNYVDVLGMDDYASAEINNLDAFESGLDMLVQTSHDRSSLKVPALTETGERWTHPTNWWTTFLYPGLVSTHDSGAQVALALAWTNWDDTHYWVPYRGAPGEADFARFKAEAPILFEDENTFRMYSWP